MNKKIIALLLACMMLLCVGCSNEAEPTEAPSEAAVTEAPVTEAPTESAATETPSEATEAPAAVMYCNPLTGEAVSEPVTSRIFAVTINNVKDALPHVGVTEADIYFEMYVNDYATRGLALYTDISSVTEIGSVRSMRYNFTDIAQAYDAFVAHAGGSDAVMSDVRKSGIDHLNVDCSDTTAYSFRNKDRNRTGIGWVHCLMAKGDGLYSWASANGITVEYDAPRTYGLSFTENGAPAGGEDATTISIDLIHDRHTKNTTMVYDAELGKYVYNEYGISLTDGNTGAPEAFENVFVLYTKVTNDDVYHVANLLGSGEGYYACDGKIVAIQWHREADTDPFTFTLADGTSLVQGIGTSYIAIAPLKSVVSWE